VHRHRVNNPSPEDLVARKTKFTPLDPNTGKRITVEKPSYPVTSLIYYPFGFVAGCIWGDDSSWKAQFLDLAEAENGVIKRDQRFGYIPLPDTLALNQAISMADYQCDPDEDWANHISIAIQKKFDLRTGKAVDEPY
jgi:hypothetical protein